MVINFKLFRFIPALLLVLGMFVSSCGGKMKGTDIEVDVTVSNTKGLDWIRFVEINVKDVKVLDSFDVRKTGKHIFHYKPKDVGFYIIRTKGNEYITLLMEPGEKAVLTIDAEKGRKGYTVTGSPGSTLLQEYFTYTDKNLVRFDSLRLAFNQARMAKDFAEKRAVFDSLYMKLFYNQRDYVKEFTRKNTNSLAPIFVINQRFGPGMVISENNDFEVLASLDSALLKKYPKNIHALEHHLRVTKLTQRRAEQKLAEERLAAGKPAPDIVLKDAKEKEVKLSSYLGKTVLVYFWTAQTAMARQDHGKMNDYFTRNRAKGLEIYGVNLDKNKELWLAAIRLDKLPWTNVSDTRNAASPLVKEYALDENLPVYYVVDKSGKMVARGRKFEEVESKLTSTLGK